MLDTTSSQSFIPTASYATVAVSSALPQSNPDPAAALFAAAQSIASRLCEGQVIDRAFLRTMLEEAFGGTDGEGLWNWKDAYEAQEAALVLTMQRYGAAILKQTPERALAMVQKLQSLTLSQTRRDDEMIALQQFSTPLPLGYAVWLAAKLSPSDSVFEPSAGTGLLAAFAQSSGCSLILNEISKRRSGFLQSLFPEAPLFHHNGEQIADHMAGQHQPDVILMNPPFSTSPNMKKTNRHVTAWHVSSALQHLREGGRLVAITGARFAAIEPRWQEPFQRLQQSCRVVFSVAIDGRLYAKHGTNAHVRLTVFDKVPADDPTDTSAYHGSVDTFSDLLTLIRDHLPMRPVLPARDQESDDAGKEKEQRSNETPSQAEPKPQVSSATLPSAVSAKSARPASDLFTPPSVDWPDVTELNYSPTDWQTPDGVMQAGLYELYQPQSVVIANAKDHPTKLVQSAAMASIAPPKPAYKPHLPLSLVTDGVISAAQLESIIYAGEAHETLLSGHYTVDESYDTLSAAHEDNEDAHQYRKGWFLGDGTGCGKGRQVAGIILDNWLKGRKRAIWVSKSDKLLEDARRDWSALGGSDDQVIPLAKFKQGDDIRLSEGILFVTYGTLRTGGKQGKCSRVEQIVNWLTSEFDGAIVFDEAHAMANATASKGNRGIKKPSQQGLAGLRLQHALPNARIVYVSATGATEVGNLAYAERLGLWGSDEFPFVNRSDFITQMEQGGVAAMEMISRDLKSLGLYTARSLSYDGVEYNPLTHELTKEQIRIYDAYAEAFVVIHHNIEVALEASKITVEGETTNAQAKAAIRSAFESAKQRFFNHLLTAMKCPSLLNAVQNDLDNGHASIIQVVSTSEALLDRRLATIPAEEWDDITVDITPREYVMDYLMHGFPVQLYEPYTDEEGNLMSRPVTDTDGNPVLCQAAVTARDSLVEKLGSLPPVPGALDQIIQHFGHERVAEVTGRSKRIIRKDDRLMVQSRSASSNLDETRAFMDDEKQVLVFSDAGGTGRSYHADLGSKNQRLRVHYLLEPGWKADTAIQGLGRSNRTNQAQPPLFRPVSTDVKGEKRFLSTIARRLDSLGAITKGQRATGGQNMFRAEDNLESPYARAALRMFYGDLYHGRIEGCSLQIFQDHTGLKLTHEGSLRQDLPPITQFLNRLLALRIDLQNLIFDAFEERHSAMIEGAKESGRFAQGVEILIADGFRIIEQQTVYTHKSGATATLITIERRDKTKTLSLEEAFALRDRDAKNEFVINDRSNRVAVKGASTSIALDNGSILPRYRLVRSNEATNITHADYDKSNWREVDETTFAQRWQEEYRAVPDYATRQFHILTGLLLPIWDLLSAEHITVNRLQTDDGQRILGRVIGDKELPGFMQGMGLENTIECTPDQIWQQVMEGGASFTLSNNWRFKRSRIMDRNRFEIIGPVDKDLPHLKATGCITEMINWQTRVFIPDNDASVKIITNIMAGKHVISQS